MPPRPPVAVAFLLLGSVVAALVVAAVAVGPVGFAPAAVLAALAGEGDPAAVTIVQSYRAPRAVLAALVGVALGCTGAAFQALFRNPLADPFVIGSSSGAALGVTLALVTGLAAPTAGAFAGAVGAVALVYAVAAAGRMPPVGLLLAGAAVSTMLSAAVWLLIALSDGELRNIIGWLMGGLAGRGWAEVEVAAGPVLVGSALLCVAGRPLDAVAAGDDVARSLGLPLGLFAGGVLAAASLAVAAAVAAGGVVGLVGLVAPHLARPLVGAGHGRLVPASGLVGAAVVLAADIAAKTANAPEELPLGVVTSLVGGPFFLAVLRRSGGRGAA